MVEAIAERKPKKLFGKKKPKLEVVRPEVPESISSVAEPIDLFSRSLKQEILLQDNKIEAVLKKTSDNLFQFQGPRVLDWNKSTGRVALAENVIKNSEEQFLVFRRQMEMMADKDGCGGRNEVGIGAETGRLNQSNIIDFGQAKLNKALGKTEDSGGEAICEHKIKISNCEECKNHKH